MTLKEIIKDRATKFVDVRTITEFNAGHITGAVNIPLDQFEHRYTEIDGLGKSPVVLYCRTGNRSGRALTFLQKKGIKNVFNGGSVDKVQSYFAQLNVENPLIGI